jgi:hypothetical protein
MGVFLEDGDRDAHLFGYMSFGGINGRSLHKRPGYRNIHLQESIAVDR